MKHAVIATLLATSLLLSACDTPEKRAADYLEKAQKAYAAEDLVKARIEAQNAVQIQPKNSEARYLLALIAERDGDVRQMVGHLTVVVDTDPENLEAQLKLGSLYYLAEAWDKTDAILEVLRRLAPDDVRVRLLGARVLLQKGERAAGLAEVEKILKDEPGNVTAIMLSAAETSSPAEGVAILDDAIPRFKDEEEQQLRELRVVLLSRSDNDREFENSLLGLITDYPAQASYRTQLAKFYERRNRLEEAEVLLRQVAMADKTDVRRRIEYVEFLARGNDPLKAETALQMFIGQTPEAGALRLMLGQYYEAANRLDDAKETYQKLAKRAPKSNDGLAARVALAAMEIRANRVAAGMSLVDAILSEAPEYPAALLLRANSRLANGRTSDAIADLRGVLRSQPQNERALLLLAQTYTRNGEAALAQDTYRRLLEVNPNSSDAVAQVAQLFAADENYAEAEKLLRARIAAQPEDLATASQLVEVLLSQDKKNEAEAEAQRMALLKSQRGTGDFALGRTLANQGKFEGATEAFQRSFAAGDDNPYILEALVLTMEAAGKERQAIAILNDQIQKGKNQLTAHLLLAGIHGRLGEKAVAASHVERVIAANGDLPYAYNVFANIYVDDPPMRIKVLRRGVDAVPGHTTLNLLLGTALVEERRFDEAIDVYEKLLQRQPDFEVGINNLAALLLDFRQDDPASQARALTLAEKLTNSDAPAVRDTLGWAYYRNKEYRKAIGILERVVAESPKVGTYRYHLGMTYLALDDPDSARRELQAALESRNDFVGRKEAEAALAEI